MQNASKNRIYTPKAVLRASLTGIIFFLVLVMVSPFTTHFHYLAFPVFYLFGETGYYLMVPALIALMVVGIVAGGCPKGTWRACIGSLILLLGIAVLWSGIHLPADALPDSYNGYFNDAMANYWAFGSNIGGGILAFLIAYGLGQAGQWLIYFIAVLVIIGGLIMAFLPLIESGIAALKAKAEASRQAKKERDAFEAAGSLDPASPSESAQPAGAAPSRVSLYATERQEKSITSSFPKDLTDESTRNLNPTRPEGSSYAEPAYNTGLREAVFMPLGEATPSTATPEQPYVKKESAPSLFMEGTSPAESPFQKPVSEPVFEPEPEPQEPSSPDITQNYSPEPKTAEAASFFDQGPIESQAPTDPMSSLSVSGQQPAQSAASPASAAAPSPAPQGTTMAEASPAPQQEPKPEPAPSPAPAPAPAQAAPAAAPKPAPAPAPAPETDENGMPLGVAQPKAKPLPKYVFPSLDLLRVYPDDGSDAKKKQETESRMQLINELFDGFHAGAHVTSYTIGPSVTRFNITTDTNVTVASVNKYVQDISVRLGGKPALYQEVVPGQTTSGLEIANDTSTTVPLKETIAALPPVTEKTRLYIPFGMSISGEFICGDLSDFPHMLISGTTGSGKSIYAHSILMSLIMRNRPEELKLVLVDPKRVEMANYHDLPHLLCPVIKEPSQAKVCLDKLISEMERRFSLFEYAGVRDLPGFNKEYAPIAHVEKLPYIVVFIDEFADLADTCKGIDESVVRLAQKARAAGIHLIIATQRPTTDVITGTIKANLPTRVALSVGSVTDSMTILGQGGAEQLAGHGDMLVDCSKVLRNGLIRAQGCFVDNKEIKAVADFIRAQLPPMYDERFLDLIDHEAEQKAAEAEGPSKAELRAAQGEDLYQMIKKDIMTKEYTSISKIQRTYGVGFPRAGKIFARLQQEGIVAEASEANNSKGCRVLVHSEAEGSVIDGAPAGGETQA